MSEHLPRCGQCNAFLAKAPCIDGELCTLCAEGAARRADHGISPAQLREKVEALNSRLDAWMSALPELPNGVQAMVVRHENELRHAFEVQTEDRARLDAALKRIEELESIVGMSALQNQVDIRKRPIPDGGKLDHTSGAKPTLDDSSLMMPPGTNVHVEDM